MTFLTYTTLWTICFLAKLHYRFFAQSKEALVDFDIIAREIPSKERSRVLNDDNDDDDDDREKRRVHGL